MIKTVQDLVDELNVGTSKDEYFISQKDDDETVIMYIQDKNEIPVFEINTTDERAYQCTGFWRLDWECIHLISEYVMEHFPYYKSKENEDEKRRTN